jgi:hypothetical protein
VEEHIRATAEIVQSADFESTVVQLTSSVPLTSEEQKALEAFRCQTAQQQQSEDEPTDFVTKVLRLAKKPRRSERGVANYTPLLSAISPTSNRLERLFS